MNVDTQIRIRPATAKDKDFLLSLVPRLTDFGAPAWRNVDEMTDIDSRILLGSLFGNDADSAIFIAVNEAGTALGFIHLHAGHDHYYKERHAHISDVIVCAAAAGQGIGSLLIAAAEAWARDKGFTLITLSVFAQNIRARALYARLGYGEDMLRCVKELG